MNSVSSVEAKLPPGFRFHPRDEELICDYLMKWTVGCAPPLPQLIEVDLNKCEPWDIPEVACVGDKEWYFYSQRDRKYATGLRTNRATVSGYWKATGKDRPVVRTGILVGMRKTLVFYQGRAPKGRKSDWVMHEFRVEGPGPKSPHVREDWVLCRVFYKSRSEIPYKSQETTNQNTTSVPPLTATQPGPSYDEYDEQVPCFSILNVQTSPTNFSLLPEMTHPKIMPNYGGVIPNLGIYNNSPLPVNANPNPNPNPDPNCDKKMIRAVLNHLTKMESGLNDQMSMKGGSPSFGEGSSDSYMSEVGFPSMWNHYG